MKTKTRDAVNAFIERNKHALLLLYFMIYLPWFGHLEKTVTTHFHVIHVALDDYIPFCEYFIIPYFLWFGYVAWAVGYFYFKNMPLGNGHCDEPFPKYSRLQFHCSQFSRMAQ